MRVGDRFEVRPARPDDTEEIARIHVEAWRDAYAALLPADYLARLNPKIEAARWSRTSRVESTLVADAQGEVAGYAIIGSARGRRGPGCGEVYALYVETDWREQGVGRALIEAAFDAFRRRGMTEAVIWCLEGNFAARGFYERCGGRRLSESRLEDVAGMPLPTLGYHWTLAR
ncbi:GNAT family N-acetyltransferase [Dongia sp.]|uniref:GNAT family N-acetyltransferase n=1 Tax=Dongia sp. TaxID=1977262 RepID=UPI003753664E